MKRVHLIISGDVQGVGFRAWMKHLAHEKEVNGWIKNRDDGSIEAVFEGEEAAVHELVEAAHNGPEIAWVDAVTVKEEECTGEFVEFEVRTD